MEKLSLTPSKDGYSSEDGVGVIRNRLDGGLSRYRRDILNPSRSVSVRWHLDPAGYQFLRTFYSGGTKEGSVPFLIDLLLDEPTLTEHTAYFVPGTLRLSSVEGLTHEVSAELEVRPAVRDEEFDAVFVAVFNQYGTGSAEALNIFEKLSNIDLPNIKGAT